MTTSEFRPYFYVVEVVSQETDSVVLTETVTALSHRHAAEQVWSNGPVGMSNDDWLVSKLGATRKGTVFLRVTRRE